MDDCQDGGGKLDCLHAGESVRHKVVSPVQDHREPGHARERAKQHHPPVEHDVELVD